MTVESEDKWGRNEQETATIIRIPAIFGDADIELTPFVQTNGRYFAIMTAQQHEGL